MIRLLSHSELQTASSCQAQHDFAYVGQLTGGHALKAKTVAPLLREGRAWGAAVARWHAEAGRTDALALALNALDESLEADAHEQREHGLYVEAEHQAMQTRLAQMLEHYTATSDPLPLDRLEGELQVGIPSRTGARRSNRYRLQAFVDGIHTDDAGRVWIVEFKLRGQLTSLALLVLSRQIRRYAWAWREIHGVELAGVIVDERWNEVPKPARLVNGRKKDQGKVASHAKDQLTTARLYREACAATSEIPEPDTVDALETRRWQQRERVLFRAGELDEIGAELVSGAQLIGQLDSGALYPVRNPGRATCNGCRYRDICADPGDVDLVDSLFARKAPKKDRTPDQEAIAA